MNPRLPSAARCLVAAALAASLLSVPAQAGEGHDHGDAPVTATGPGLPRFVAVSETFELVGVLKGKQLVLYLDRTDDNSPVRGAQIELDIAGTKFKAQKQGEDEYEVVLPEAPKPGVLVITATVTAGAESDLLGGELDLHDDSQAGAAVRARGWQEYAGWTAGGLVALGMLAWGVRRFRSSRQAHTAAAA